LTECEEANQNTQKEANKYAKVIKNELYRMLSVPIMVYIIYNAYYMFFFKDCYSEQKKTDENGKNIYIHSCTPGEKGGCFTPIFPDWEALFHSVEKGKLNYFFEFIFKPVKMLYTLLNAFKAFFRKSMPLFGVVKDQVPYVFFFWTVSHVYVFLQSYGAKILSVMYGLLYLNVPDVELMSGFTLQSLTKTIITIFFGLTFLKDFADIRLFGDDNPTTTTGGTEPSPPVQGDAGVSGGAPPVPPGPDGKKPGMFSKMKSGISGAFASMTEKKTWKEWLFIPAGALMTVIKWISAILFWVFKYIISIGLTTFSMFITLVYFAWVSIFGLTTFATPIQGAGDKIDLIHRVMYTKLCDNDKDDLFKYSVKSLFFFGIYFLTEFIIIHNLLKGMKKFRDMPAPAPPQDPNMSSKKDTTANNLAVKSFMIIVYGILLVIIGLWCAYKFKFQMPDVVRAYKEQDDDNRDKRFDYACNEPDAIERESKNSVIKTIMKSDAINKAFIQEFNTKTAGMFKPSALAGFINKMGEYKDKLNEGINSVISKAKEFKDSAKDSFKRPDSRNSSTDFTASEIMKASAKANYDNFKNSIPTIPNMFAKKGGEEPEVL
jgi:hypothetical protein